MDGTVRVAAGARKRDPPWDDEGFPAMPRAGRLARTPERPARGLDADATHPAPPAPVDPAGRARPRCGDWPRALAGLRQPHGGRLPHGDRQHGERPPERQRQRPGERNAGRRDPIRHARDHRIPDREPIPDRHARPRRRPPVPATPPPTARPTPVPPPPPSGGTAVLVGAGDISTGGAAEKATAALLAKIPGTVFTAGDNAYNDGSKADYVHFNASWGAFKSRMRPAPGNHDYHLSPQYYYTYFGAAAGPPGLGYYVYTLGAWRIYSLNGETPASTAQIAWLKNDLAAHPSACVLAYWHEPRFSSGQHGSDPSYAPFWDALYAAKAEVIINGHDHDYERFAPQNPAGQASATGIREFVVGTGGAGLRGFTHAIANSEVRNGVTNGVLKLTLGPGRYGWQFIPVAGQSFTDSGQGTCH